MKRVLLTSLVLGFLVATAAAQHPPGGPMGQPSGDRSEWFDGMLNRVANRLELDESQREQFNEITAQYRERMQEMGQRWRELRQARRDGDEERAAALRAELEPAHGAGSVFAGLFEEVEPLLREDQLERLNTMRERMQQGRQRGEMYRRVMTELPEELGLDEGQREQWDQLLASRREQRHQQWAEMRPIWEEMRAAREAGDEERLEELRAQLEEMRPGEESRLRSFFDQLQGILRDDQMPILDRYRQEFAVGARQESRPGDVRDILRAVKRLRLSSEQREAIKRIEQDAGKARREIDRRDSEANDRLAAMVKEQITEILDPEQREQFEQHLKRLERGSRRSRNDRPGPTP